MEIVRVAVGSTRRPKLAGLRGAMEQLGPKLAPGAQFEVAGVEVPSGVSHTPLSRAETMAGARNRVEALVRLARERGETRDWFVGLEGGLDIVPHDGKQWVFLENWAYVRDARGRGAFGQSGAVALPQELAARVVDEGIELAEAIDAFTGEQGIRDAQGAWGVLTRGIITREDAFCFATVNAFAPFLNPWFF